MKHKPSVFVNKELRNERTKASKKEAKAKAKENRKLEEAEGPENPDVEKTPISKSMVFKRGKVTKAIKQLVVDFRRVMEPHTATRLQETNANTVKDFLHVASMYSVTHFVSFTNTDLSPYMSVAKLPRGPTLTFKIDQFALIHDITMAKLKYSSPVMPDFIDPPLVVLNGFTKGTPQMEVMSTILQNMFPAINISTLELSKCKRIVLFSYNKSKEVVEFRHYKIKIGEVGVSKSIKRVIQSKVGDLSDLTDISEFVLGAIGASESDYEDAQDGKVEIDNSLLKRRRGTTSSNQKSIRLVELGPRLSLDLIKVEDNLFSGEVLFHKYIQKTEDEVYEQRLRLQEKKLEKKRRSEMQEANLKAKEEEIKKKIKKREDKQQRRKDREEGGDDLVKQKKREEKMKEKKATQKGEANNNSKPEDFGSDDDDAEWFRKEVGHDPDETFSGKSNDRSNDRSKKRIKRH